MGFSLLSSLLENLQGFKKLCRSLLKCVVPQTLKVQFNLFFQQFKNFLLDSTLIIESSQESIFEFSCRTRKIRTFLSPRLVYLHDEHTFFFVKKYTDGEERSNETRKDFKYSGRSESSSSRNRIVLDVYLYEHKF